MLFLAESHNTADPVPYLSKEEARVGELVINSVTSFDVTELIEA